GGARIATDLDARRLLLERVDPATVSAGEVAHRVRAAAETLRERLAMVVLDGLDGWGDAVPSREYWHRQLRQLCAYLNRRGVIVLLLHTEHATAEPYEPEELCDVAVRTT